MDSYDVHLARAGLVGGDLGPVEPDDALTVVGEEQSGGVEPVLRAASVEVGQREPALLRVVGERGCVDGQETVGVRIGEGSEPGSPASASVNGLPMRSRPSRG